jgi:citrate lyase subunit beta / citryl-CoA lyase
MTVFPASTGGPHAPRRSCLFVPAFGDLAAAAASEADSLLFDLEDACPPDKKAEGRARVASALESGMFDGKTCTVRVNSVSTPWCYRDIIDVVGGADGHLDSLTIPKFTDESEVMFVDHLLTQLELDLGLTETVELELLVETAGAVARLREVACVSEPSRWSSGPTTT